MNTKTITITVPSEINGCPDGEIRSDQGFYINVRTNGLEINASASSEGIRELMSGFMCPGASQNDPVVIGMIKDSNDAAVRLSDAKATALNDLPKTRKRRDLLKACYIVLFFIFVGLLIFTGYGEYAVKIIRSLVVLLLGVLGVRAIRPGIFMRE